jgi:predicted acylesterase/phospholipase RssA
MATNEVTSHHEFRVGAVFYGGVSLAVYENGVARAFFDAATSAGLFRPLLDLIDTRFIVDVVSGSSAGGINGLLLAAALERGYPFAQTAELWREHGGIEDLLRPANAARPVSLLEGKRFYLKQLREAFRRICHHHPAADYEPPQEIDVFVTGTNLAGAEGSFTDAFGEQVPTRTHRMVFHLQHRQGRKELGYVVREQNSSSERAQATTPKQKTLQADILASVARITSSFPGAFAPFTVGELADDGAAGADTPARARYALGRLSDCDLDDDPPLIDGGVLDNRPFGPLLEAVFHRMPSATMRGLTRRVFYVDPDPDVFKREKKAQFSPLSVAVNSVVSLPSYDSITADVDQVATHNARMAHLRSLRKRLATDPRSCDLDAPLYRYALERELMALLDGAQLPSPQDPDGVEQEELSQRAPTAAALRALSIGYHLRRATSLFYGYASKDGNPAVDCHDTDEQPYQVGRVVKALKLLRDVWASELSRTKRYVDTARRAGVPLDRQPAWPTLRERLSLLEHYVAGSWVSLPEGSSLASYQLTSADLASDRLSELATAARTELRRFLPQPPASACDKPVAPQAIATLQRTGSAEASGGLIELLQRHLIELLHDPSKLDEFSRKDAALYPLELASGTHELDEIQIVRISPDDPELPRGISGHAKLTGDELAHFSAFLRRDFRTNDVAWGHVDAIDRIARALSTEDARGRAKARLAQMAPQFSVAALQASANVAQVPAAQQASVLTELMSLAQAFSNCLREGDGLTPLTWQAFVNAFITAAQTRAASEYIELVRQDARDQDLAFNWKETPPLRHVPGSALSQLVALRRGETPILQAMPPSIIVEYGARAALLLWGMVEQSLPNAKPLARARPFVVGALSVIHALAVLLRRQERVVGALMFGTLSASLAFIVALAFGGSAQLLVFALIGMAICMLGAIYVRSLRWVGGIALATALLVLAAVALVITKSSVSLILPWSEKVHTYNIERRDERDLACASSGEPLLSRRPNR